MTTSSGRPSSPSPAPPPRAPDTAGGFTAAGGLTAAARPAAADPVGEAARGRFGVASLYPVQRFVVANVLEGRSQVVVLPTGTGKSMCFQLPSLFLPGPTLVLVPLLSLMADQLRKLAEAGVPAAALRGGMSGEEKAALFDAMRAGRARIVLATPEACLVPATAAELSRCGVAHLVVDEAHCISEWGDSFRPAYRAVGEVARGLGFPVTSAFTATASPAVLDRIRGVLFPGADVRVVSGSPDRPATRYEVRAVLARERELVQLARGAARPLLVFCRTRSGSEVAARAVLRRCPGTDARFYHAGLDAAERARIEAWFLGAADAVLFATTAYGMGVDKPDIRTVVHADVPLSVEAYLQESGRAGRDGLPCRAVLLRSPSDDAFLDRLEDPVARQRFSGMLGYADGPGCRRAALLHLIGQEEVPCGGCDACDGEAGAEAPGRREILRFASRHRRRFAPAEAAAILSGEPGPRTVRGFHDCVPGWNVLAGWTRGDVEEAIDALAAGGRLRVRARGPWKGRLDLGPGPATRGRTGP